jgi:hypothetical protein
MGTGTNQVVVGQLVHCILYGGMDGIVYAVHGPQTPETIRSLSGVIQYGGSAYFDIVFTGHKAHVSRGVPEAIVRGVQWRIREDVASPEEIATAIHLAEHAEARAKAKAEADAARRAQEREQHAKANPHLLTKTDRPDWSPGRLAAENIRRELKRAFPGVKFRVTSDYNTVRADWIDGPTSNQVEAITSKYPAGSFNGMEDIYERDPDATFGDVFGGPKYVFCRREWTVEAVRAAWEKDGRDGAEVGDEWYNGPIAHFIREAWSRTAFGK